MGVRAGATDTGAGTDEVFRQSVIPVNSGIPGMPDSPGKSVMAGMPGMTGIPGAGPALNNKTQDLPKIFVVFLVRTCRF